MFDETLPGFPPEFMLNLFQCGNDKKRGSLKYNKKR